MKKFTALILAVLTLLSLAVMPISAESEIQVYINGKSVSFDQPPVIIDGRTLVPMRAIFEAMDSTVDWNADTRTAIGTKGDTTVKITIDEKTLYKNGTGTELDVPAQLVNSRTMVPARAISEAFGAYVSWNPVHRCVFVETEDEFKARLLAKIGTHSEIILTYDTILTKKHTTYYGKDYKNHLAVFENDSVYVYGDTTVPYSKFGNISDGNITYYYSDDEVRVGSMDVWNFPANNFIELILKPIPTFTEMSYAGVHETLICYAYELKLSDNVSETIRLFFDSETAELVAITAPPAVTEHYLGEYGATGAGDELIVYYAYDSNAIKPQWDSILSIINQN